MAGAVPANPADQPDQQRQRVDPLRFAKLVKLATRKGRDVGLSPEAYLYAILVGELPPLNPMQVDDEPLL
jgi:hypothetical protein